MTDNSQREDCTIKSCNNCLNRFRKFSTEPCCHCKSNRGEHQLDVNASAVITAEEIYGVPVDNMPITGLLDNWFIAWNNTVVGQVYGDIHNRFKSGLILRTSRIIPEEALKAKKGVVIKTMNSKYLLGEPYESRK